MGRIQRDHAKPWLAGEARNWELAGYQLSELKEVFSDVQDLVPSYHNIPIGDMIDAIITGTITELEDAIAARDFSKISTSSDGLTAACNSCHQAANRGFIVIRRPAQSNFSSHDFSPAAKRVVPKGAIASANAPIPCPPDGETMQNVVNPRWLL